MTAHHFVPPLPITAINGEDMPMNRCWAVLIWAPRRCSSCSQEVSSSLETRTWDSVYGPGDALLTIPGLVHTSPQPWFGRAKKLCWDGMKWHLGVIIFLLLEFIANELSGFGELKFYTINFRHKILGGNSLYTLSSDSLRAVILSKPINIGQIDLGETLMDPRHPLNLQSNPKSSTMADEAQLYQRSCLYMVELWLQRSLPSKEKYSHQCTSKQVQDRPQNSKYSQKSHLATKMLCDAN